MGIPRQYSSAPCYSDYFSNPVVTLTCSLLFLLELLLLFLVFGFCVKVVVAVLGELPLIGLVHQI